MSKGSRGKIFSKLNKVRSLRFVIAAVIVVACIIPVIVTYGIFVKSYTNKTIDSTAIEVQGQLSLLGADIASGDYLVTGNSDVVNTGLELISYTYSARVRIIDRDFIVRKDTFAYDEGKTIVASNVLSAYKGNAVTDKSYNSGYIEITTPIYSEDNESILGVMYLTMTDPHIGVMQEYLHRIFVGLILVFSMISVILGATVSHFCVKPLEKLGNSIIRISSGSKTDHVEKRTLYEYEKVAEAVNLMLDRIRVLDTSRDEFVSNVSHELKTPMTSMKVLADSLIAQDNVPVEIYRDFMNDIVTEIDRENKIISDLLSLVKVDQTNAELNIATVNINELVELILKRLKPIAVQKNIELVFESFRPVAAEIDEVKLTLAITNLVENSIKYNVDNGWVRVSVNADHKYFYIKVSDSGIGIPNECKEQIFERFYRVDKARSRESGGTGLGLAITKSVILMHKGIIKLYSKENEGTTFTVRIPLYYVKGGEV